MTEPSGNTQAASDVEPLREPRPARLRVAAPSQIRPTCAIAAASIAAHASSERHCAITSVIVMGSIASPSSASALTCASQAVRQAANGSNGSNGSTADASSCARARVESIETVAASATRHRVRVLIIMMSYLLSSYIRKLYAGYPLRHVESARQVRSWNRPTTSRSEEIREFAGRCQRRTRSPPGDRKSSSDGDLVTYLIPEEKSRLAPIYA
ncbi:MAG: hypothetical protein AAB668_03685 [Patescibacteria group bacterium]